MSNPGSWLGTPMMNPQGKIGKVTKDNNVGRMRILTIELEDKSTEELWLSNLGHNPKESQKWMWWFKPSDGSKPHWVAWGE